MRREYCDCHGCTWRDLKGKGLPDLPVTLLDWGDGPQPFSRLVSTIRANDFSPAAKEMRSDSHAGMEWLDAPAEDLPPGCKPLSDPDAYAQAWKRAQEWTQAFQDNARVAVNAALSTQDGPVNWDDLQSALWAISPDLQSTWSEVAWALYPLGEEGLALYLKWSQQCDTKGLWDHDAALKKWNDKASTWGPEQGIGRYKTIFDKAKALGWASPKRENKPDGKSRTDSDVVLRSLSDVEMKKIDWIWDGYLAKG